MGRLFRGADGPFHDLAILQHKQLVGVADGAQAVGDDKAGAAVQQPGKRLLDEQLGAGVHAAGCLVQDQQARVGEDGTRDGEELPLALTQVAALLRKLCLVAIRHAGDKGIGVGQLGRLDHLLVAGVQPPVADVVQDGAAEEEGILQNDAHLRPQAGAFHLA